MNLEKLTKEILSQSYNITTEAGERLVVIESSDVLDILKRLASDGDLAVSSVSQQSELLIDFWMNLPNTNKNKGVAKYYVDEYLKSTNASESSLPLKIERIIAFVAKDWGDDHGGSTRGILGNDAIEICKEHGIDWANYR